MVYVLIVLVILGLILNKLSKKYSFYKLHYKRNISKNYVEIDEEFEITTILENKKILPVTYLRVTEKFPEDLKYKFPSNVVYAGEYLYHDTTMYLMPRQRVKRTYKVSFNSRGRHIINDVSMIVGDFLGTSITSKQLSILQEITVYPRSLNLNEELKAYGSYYGDISVRRWIISDPILTLGIREYTGAEPQKSIHWPSSLRTGRLMVKNFDYTTDNNVVIALNIECSKPFWSHVDIGKIEKCISTTRGVMEELEEAGIPYGFTTNIQLGNLISNKYTVPVGYGTAHFYSILELLGRADYSISMIYEELINNLLSANNRNTTYVLILPILLKEYVEGINLLSSRVEKLILITFKDENLDKLNEKITVFIGRQD